MVGCETFCGHDIRPTLSFSSPIILKGWVTGSTIPLWRAMPWVLERAAALMASSVPYLPRIEESSHLSEEAFGIPFIGIWIHNLDEISSTP